MEALDDIPVALFLGRSTWGQSRMAAVAYNPLETL